MFSFVSCWFCEGKYFSILPAWQSICSDEYHLTNGPVPPLAPSLLWRCKYVNSLAIIPTFTTMTSDLSSCFIVRLLRYSDVTWSPWCLRSPTARLFVQRTVQIANMLISLNSVLQCKLFLNEWARWVILVSLVFHHTMYQLLPVGEASLNNPRRHINVPDSIPTSGIYRVTRQFFRYRKDGTRSFQIQGLVWLSCLFRKTIT